MSCQPKISFLDAVRMASHAAWVGVKSGAAAAAHQVGDLAGHAVMVSAKRILRSEYVQGKILDGMNAEAGPARELGKAAFQLALDDSGRKAELYQQMRRNTVVFALTSDPLQEKMLDALNIQSEPDRKLIKETLRKLYEYLSAQAGDNAEFIQEMASDVITLALTSEKFQKQILADLNIDSDKDKLLIVNMLKMISCYLKSKPGENSQLGEEIGEHATLLAEHFVESERGQQIIRRAAPYAKEGALMGLNLVATSEPVQQAAFNALGIEAEADQRLVRNGLQVANDHVRAETPAEREAVAERALQLAKQSGLRGLEWALTSEKTQEWLFAQLNITSKEEIGLIKEMLKLVDQYIKAQPDQKQELLKELTVKALDVADILMRMDEDGKNASKLLAFIDQFIESDEGQRRVIEVVDRATMPDVGQEKPNLGGLALIKSKTGQLLVRELASAANQLADNNKSKAAPLAKYVMNRIAGFLGGDKLKGGLEGVQKTALIIAGIATFFFLAFLAGGIVSIALPSTNLLMKCSLGLTGGMLALYMATGAITFFRLYTMAKEPRKWVPVLKGETFEKVITDNFNEAAIYSPSTRFWSAITLKHLLQALGVGQLDAMLESPEFNASNEKLAGRIALATPRS